MSFANRRSLWQDGGAAVVSNHLVKHGRRSFSGDRPRKVFVALGL